MKELLVLPLVFSLMIGVAIELSEIAETSSEKAIRYTEAMEKGIDCAFRGELILECSPELASMDFDEDIDGFDDTLVDFRGDVEEIYDQLNETEREKLEEDIDGIEDLMMT